MTHEDCGNIEILNILWYNDKTNGGEYMELYASDMFFRGDNEKEQAYDCCIHGSIIFKIGDNLLSDNTEWCVSASAYRFLHTLFENHFMGAEDFLIPCCGHTMIPSEEDLFFLGALPASKTIGNSFLE